jgi:hypothetical protein
MQQSRHVHRGSDIDRSRVCMHLIKSECRAPDGFSRFISPLLIFERKGWAAQSINFLIGSSEDVTTLKLARAHGPCFLTGSNATKKPTAAPFQAHYGAEPFLTPQAEPDPRSFFSTSRSTRADSIDDLSTAGRCGGAV